ncbi:MAG: methyltransferase, TIGR04325 family [Nitrososphaerota archaeon]
MSWNIIEQEKFVEKGKKLFPNGEIKFFDNLLEANTICEHDFILLSGVIQYLKEPFLILNQILKYNFKYILLDRTPVSKLDEEFITIQTTTPDYPYFASYPCWIFSEKKLLNHIKKILI